MNDLCSIEWLRRAVSRGLPADEEAALHAHLEHCESCCAHMEQLAGGDAWQQETAALLSADALDATVPEPAGWSEVDFSVEHLEPSDDPDVLGQLGGYDVLAVVGRGGMGVVLKAFDRELKRFVAIKALAPHLAHSSVARRRFAREARAAAAVVDPHVIAIHHVQPAGRTPFLIMPLLCGESLAQRLKARGPLELTEVLRIGMQTGAGLAAAHGQGLVHRDVKPANIFLEKGVERVVITDFGLARAGDDVSMTRLGVVAGTPEYMAPEQARGEALDGRSDLFSLGCVLYEMATGVSPFRTDSMMATLRRVVDEQPAAMASLCPELPPWFTGIVGRLLSKDPADRFASASEVSQLLEQCLSHLQQPTSVPLPACLVPQTVARRWIFHPRRIGVIAMLGVAGFFALGTVLWQASDAPPASNRDSISARSPATSQPNAAEPTPRRIHHFAGVATGHDVRVACSPDGKLIAIANGNPTLIMLGGGRSQVADDWKPTAHILDAETGKTVVSLPLTTPDEDAVLAATERLSHIEATALAFSPDGKQVAVGSSVGQVKVFEARTGALIRSLDDEVTRLADTKTPESWRLLRRALGSVASLAFSPDGVLLAMCGSSFGDYSQHFDGVDRLGFRSTGPGRLKLWHVPTGTLKHGLAGHNDQAYAVCFSPDGHWLASAGRWMDHNDRFGNGVILWNAQTGAQIRSFTTTANAGARSIAFSPDSKLLAMGTQRFDNAEPNGSSTGGVSLVHVSSGIEEWLVTVPGWARPVAFSSDSRRVVVLCGGRSLRFLDTETGIVRHEIRPADSPRGARWDDLAIAPRGGVLAIGAVDHQLKGSVDVWSTLSQHNANVPAATSSSGTTKASSSSRNFTTRASVRPIACSADGKLLAIANGSPTFIGIKAKANIKDNWKPSAEVLEATTGRTIASLRLTTDAEDAVFAATDLVTHFEVTALALSPDGGAVAVGTSVGQVKVFQARTGELIQSLDDAAGRLADEKTPADLRSLRRALGSVASLAFSPDGVLLATCGNSFSDYSRSFQDARRFDELSTGPGRLKVWDVKTGTLGHDLVGHSHANALAFSPDGRVLASAGRWLNNGSSGTGVILWDARAGTKVRTVLTEANGSAHSVAFSPDAQLLAVSTLHFDVDRANDSTTTAISLVQAASGVVQWRRVLRGPARQVAFCTGTVMVLNDEHSMLSFEPRTGATLFALRPDPRHGVRWNDFAIAKQGRMWALGGQDEEGRGSIEVLGTDGPGAAP